MGFTLKEESLKKPAINPPQRAHGPCAPLKAMIRIFIHHEGHEEHEGSENETLQALLQPPNIEIDQKPLA
jgi:hypothetical protein